MDAALVAAFGLAAIVEAGLVRRIVQARRSGDGARLRFLVPQAVGLLLASADVVRQWGWLPGGGWGVTDALFWVGLALIAFGLTAQAGAPRPRK